MITIPIQLQGCTFILLKEQGTVDAKHPKAGPDGHNVYVTADEAATYPWNLGIVCRQPLVVVDVDDMDLAFSLGIFQLLPTTFTVETGSGGRHYYYYDDVSEVTTYHSLSSDGKHYGEVRRGQQVYVVGPGSIHPNGKPYKVVRDVPIAPFSIDAFLEATGTTKKGKYVPPVVGESSTSDLGFNVLDVVSVPSNAVRTPRGIQFANPWHGSHTGKNFTVFEDGDAFYCHRCGVAGNAARALALMEGITHDCSHKLTKEEFIAVMRIAEQRGLVEARPNRDIQYVTEAELRSRPTPAIVTKLQPVAVTVTTVENKTKLVAKKVV